MNLGCKMMLLPYITDLAECVLKGDVEVVYTPVGLYNVSFCSYPSGMLSVMDC